MCRTGTARWGRGRYHRARKTSSLRPESHDRPVPPSWEACHPRERVSASRPALFRTRRTRHVSLNSIANRAGPHVRERCDSTSTSEGADAIRSSWRMGSDVLVALTGSDAHRYGCTCTRGMPVLQLLRLRTADRGRSKDGAVHVRCAKSPSRAPPSSFSSESPLGFRLAHAASAAMVAAPDKSAGGSPSPVSLTRASIWMRTCAALSAIPPNVPECTSCEPVTTSILR